MVPEALAGADSRGARLDPHGNRAAHRAKGLEASLLDRQRTVITALEPSDERSVEIWVAGPSALLIAKIHKINERLDSPDRLNDKDALDVFRLLQSVSTISLCNRLNELRTSDLAGDVTAQAIDVPPVLFGKVILREREWPFEPLASNHSTLQLRPPWLHSYKTSSTSSPSEHS